MIPSQAESIRDLSEAPATKSDRGDSDFPRLIAPVSCTERLDLHEIFGRNAPLQVDLGCGNGSFLCELAQRMPANNFLGVERLLGRAQSSARKAKALGNVRVLRFETSYVVRHLLPPASVEKFYLLFPDPWPKRRHQRRRIVTVEFLKSIHDALAPGGVFHVATDQRDYLDQVKEHAAELRRFNISDADRADLPFTKFERKFNEQGAPIYRIELLKK